MRSLTSDAAERKTFELVTEQGPAPVEPGDVEALFAALEADLRRLMDGDYGG